jgi:DNA-binding transcriptional LysR family regulator
MAIDTRKQFFDTVSAMARGSPSLSGINTNLIVALHALLEEENVSRAAQAAGLGQSSMSYALSRLRAHFGDPLLVQDGRKMVPTRLARSLVGPVRQAVTHLERVFSGSSSFDPATSTRTFHVASTDNIELVLLPPLSRLLQADAPGIEVRIYSLAENWRSALKDGELDLKLGRSYDPGPGFIYQDLLRERIVGAVREAHPLKARRISLERYASLRHIRISPTPRVIDTVADLIDAQLHAVGLVRNVVLTVPHFLVAPFIVASSDLMLTAPARVIEAFRRPLHLRIVQPALTETEYSFSQVWSERADSDSGLQWFRHAIQRALVDV